MARAERDGDRLVVECHYTEKDLVKQVPGSAWDSRKERWHCPLTWASCVSLRLVFGERLELGPLLWQWATAEKERWIDRAMQLRDAKALDLREWPELADIDLDIRNESGYAPYDHQLVNAAFASLGECVLFEDEPGAGKTGSASISLRLLHKLHRDALPALVVCPKSVKIKWAREFERWWPGLKVVVISGTAARRKKLLLAGDWDVAIMNPESIKAHSRVAPFGSTTLTKCPAHGGTDDKITDAKCHVHPKELNEIELRSVVVDECHMLRNQSLQTRAIWAVGRQPGVRYRLGLTGTPIAEGPADAWGQLHFIAPDEHPGKSKYIDLFVEVTTNWAGYTEYGGLKPQNKAAFFAITDPRTRRVTKLEAMPNLPPIVQDPRPLEMDAKQAKAYAEMAAKQVAMLESGLLIVDDPLQKAGRLTMFASAYAELVIDDVNCKHRQPVGGYCETCPGRMALPNETVLLSEPSNKLDALQELIEELKGAPLVAYAPSRQLIELAGKRMDAAKYPYSMVKGGQTEGVRQYEIDRYMKGETNLILINDAGGVGLDLNRGRNLVFLQRSWANINNVQVVGRVHRGGSEVFDSVQITDFFSDGTIEVGQRDSLDGKAMRAEEFVRDAEALAKMLHLPPEAKKTRGRKKKKDEEAA